MDKKIIQIKQNTHSLQLTWVINNICTNHCDYCPPILNKGTNHGYDWNNAKSFINRLLKRYPKIHCAISGGEPTLSPFLPEMIEMFQQAGHTVGLTSNGARSIRYIEEISKYLSYISFSYHPQYDDKSLLEKAIAASNNCLITIRIMMDSRYWDLAVSRYNEFIQHPEISVETVRILPEMAHKHVGDDYNQDQIQWLECNPGGYSTKGLYNQNNKLWKPAINGATFYWDDGSVDQWGDANKLVSRGLTDFRGWACNIGLESLFVDFTGNVSKGNCRQGGKIFHIDSHEQYELPTRGEICEQHLCHCATDVYITKSNMKELTYNEQKTKKIMVEKL